MGIGRLLVVGHRAGARGSCAWGQLNACGRSWVRDRPDRSRGAACLARRHIHMERPRAHNPLREPTRRARGAEIRGRPDSTHGRAPPQDWAVFLHRPLQGRSLSSSANSVVLRGSRAPDRDASPGHGLSALHGGTSTARHASLLHTRSPAGSRTSPHETLQELRPRCGHPRLREHRPVPGHDRGPHLDLGRRPGVRRDPRAPRAVHRRAHGPGGRG